MNPITDIWRQLVRRRLWPVAIVLVGALAAVPVLLAKDPEPTIDPAPPVATADDGGVLATEPIVAPAAAADPDASRRPLGNRHDIFKPTKKPVKAKAAKQDKAAEGGSSKPADGSSGGSSDKPDGGGSTGGDTGTGGSTPTPVTPPVEEPKPEPKTYPLYSLKVRFSGGDTTKSRVLARNAALPSAVDPLIIYLGLEDDHKTAVFLIDSTLQAIGDGHCDPSPENCETVRMRAGDTMFFDEVGEDGETSGEQFQLDLVKVHTKKTTDAAKAARSARLASVARASAGGRLQTGLGSRTG